MTAFFWRSEALLTSFPLGVSDLRQRFGATLLRRCRSSSPIADGAVHCLQNACHPPTHCDIRRLPLSRGEIDRNEQIGLDDRHCAGDAQAGHGAQADPEAVGACGLMDGSAPREKSSASQVAPLVVRAVPHYVSPRSCSTLP
jgi:hypothetical protein